MRSSGACALDPAFVIDIDAGAVLDANSAGWSFWTLDPTTPLAIDTAMPAVRRLREIKDAPDFGTRQERLTFWTARGLVELDCLVAPHEGSISVVFVQSLQAPPLSRPAQAAAMPSASDDTCRARDLEGLEVHLGPWLAHELRTPLSAVIAYAEILKNEHFGPLANARYKSYASDIYDSARHALGVADSMLHGDRARADLPALVFADLEPADVVEHCITVARPLAERAGLELDVALPERLPRIVADEVSLRQMLLNLLSNAIKFARTGDRVTVAVTYDCGGPLTLSVADTGPGMSEARRGDRASLGLGLPLTRALAAANGASLGIESAAGSGTRVTIAFGKDRVVPV